MKIFYQGSFAIKEVLKKRGEWNFWYEELCERQAILLAQAREENQLLKEELDAKFALYETVKLRNQRSRADVGRP